MSKLNEAVAIHVMGFKPVGKRIVTKGAGAEPVEHLTFMINNREQYAPRYDEDIKEAWGVVDKFKKDAVNLLYHPDAPDCWNCMIGEVHMFGRSASEAICLAALKAVGVNLP